MDATRVLIAGIIGAVISYLLGSVNFAVITSLIIAKDDIRKHGSGNAGMTNMLRTYGIGPAFVTALGDFLKGFVAILICKIVFYHFDVAMADPSYVAGFFAIIGHMFPVFFKFKGGKGVMTALGVLISLNWTVFLMTLCIAVPMVFITRTVSVGSINGAIAFFVLNCYWQLQSKPDPFYQILFTALIAGVILYMHRANIKRLYLGCENRFGKREGNDMDILVMGSGGFGTALAVMAHNQCRLSTALWTPFEQEAAMLREKREHEKLLPGIPIPDEIAILNQLEGPLDCRLAVIATPSFAVRQTAAALKGLLPTGTPVACVSKGIEAGTYLTHDQIIEQELPGHPPVIISGPSHAEELARGVATNVVAASRYRASAELVQDLLMNQELRIYTSDDVLGVELGGALKNVIALAAGILDGLQAGGDNTKAALMTRGITEIARLGVAMGAKSETFTGLSGIGDLIVTCSSMHSRNRRFGILIGEGRTVDEALLEIGMTVEGYPSTKVAYELSKRTKVDMPIVTETYEVLYCGKKPADGLRDLMGRPKRHESETIWLLSR